MKKYTARETAAYNRANAIVHEVLLAIRTVTAFGGQRRELERSIEFIVLNINHLFLLGTEIV